MASYSHRTAQPPTLAIFLSWGSLAGAGRIRLAAANIRHTSCLKNLRVIKIFKKIFQFLITATYKKYFTNYNFASKILGAILKPNWRRCIKPTFNCGNTNKLVCPIGKSFVIH
jgi:hypothetical protein